MQLSASSTNCAASSSASDCGCSCPVQCISSAASLCAASRRPSNLSWSMRLLKTMPCSCIVAANCLNFLDFLPCLSRWQPRLCPVTSSIWSFSVDHFAVFIFEAAQGDVMMLMLDACNVDSSGLVMHIDSDMLQQFIQLICV